MMLQHLGFDLICTVFDCCWRIEYKQCYGVRTVVHRTVESQHCFEFCWLPGQSCL